MYVSIKIQKDYLFATSSKQQKQQNHFFNLKDFLFFI